MEIKNSPWGKVQNQNTVKGFDDIISVSTASHGGIRIPAKYFSSLSDTCLINMASEKNKSFAWFEEDEAWQLPIAEIKHASGELSDEELINSLKRGMIYYHLEYLQDTHPLAQRILKLKEKGGADIDLIFKRIEERLSEIKGRENPDCIMTRVAIDSPYSASTYLGFFGRNDLRRKDMTPEEFADLIIEQGAKSPRSKIINFISKKSAILAFTKKGEAYLIRSEEKQKLITDYKDHEKCFLGLDK